MTKAMLKTMAAIALLAAFTLVGASQIALAQGAAPSAPAPAMDEAGTKSFKLVSVEVDGTKFWLPSVIAVEQGDKVKLRSRIRCRDRRIGAAPRFRSTTSPKS